MSIAIGSSGPLTSIPGAQGLSLGGGLVGNGETSGFSDILKNAIGQVGNLQNSAEQQVTTLLQGGSADMSKVMVSVEKADVAFQLMLQVRNKIVSAYQDIEKMQF